MLDERKPASSDAPAPEPSERAADPPARP
jgi:hypothetical protein